MNVGDDIGAVPVVDDEGISAAAPCQNVIAKSAGDDVGRSVANYDVGFGIAGGVNCCGARERQILDVVGKRVGHGGVDCIDPAAVALDNLRVGIRYDISVIAGSAAHNIGAPRPSEQIVARGARQGVGTSGSSNRIRRSPAG